MWCSVPTWWPRAAAGDIDFQGTVNATHPLLTLTIDTGGVTTFGSAVGNTAPFPLALVTDSEGISGEKTVLAGGTVHATTIDFKDDVTLAADAVITGTTVTLKKMVNADSAANHWAYLVNSAGVTTFGGAVGTTVPRWAA